MKKIPSIVDLKEAELYELCENHHKNGRLATRDVANFLGVDYNWFLAACEQGKIPFAMSYNSGGKRNVCIHVLPFYTYMTKKN